jgi:deazaflavin-dependent oxidoreductase (nitroreductase family)
VNEDAFPDVRWGHEPPSALRKPVIALIGSKLGAWCIRKLTPVDRQLLRRSNGRLTIFGPVGVPLLLLTTTGRKSCARREIPLTYLREGDRIFLVGSNFGQANHPAWSWNLLADPKAWVTMGGNEIAVVATPLTGTEHDRIFRKFADYGANYDAYQSRTDRELRVFALTRR